MNTPKSRLSQVLLQTAALALLLLLGGCEGTGDFTQAVGKGSIWMFVAAFVGGMLVTFTPCVYPLIPITVSIFGGMASDEEDPKKRRRRAALSGVSYVLGIALMYSSLGLLAGLAGKGAVDEHMGSPWFILPVVALFVTFSVSMFGAFEIQLPASWQAKLSGVGGAGILGGFLMGLVAGLLAAPCTGPVIAGILTYIATTQQAFTGFWLLFTFSMGFGVMFFVIATFASALPKSGPWMDGVKSVFGVLMLVGALYYLSSLIPALNRLRVRETWILLGGLGITVVGIAVGGIHRHFHERRFLPVARKLAGVILLVAGLFAAMQWTRGSTVKFKYKSIPKALAAAKQAKKPLLMDFWATWCEGCIELEKEVLAHPKVSAYLKKNWLMVKVDCTKRNDKNKQIKRRWGVKGLPTLVLVNSKGKRVKNLVGKPTPSLLLKELKKIR